MHTLGGIALLLLVAVAALTLEAWVVMMLWNALIPSLFAGPVLGFWQACMLVSLLNTVGRLLRGTTRQESH